MKLKLTNFLILITLFLSACGQSATSPSPIATAEEESVEVEAGNEAQVEAGECIACHTDKQRLIETAAVVVEAEPESKGVG